MFKLILYITISSAINFVLADQRGLCYPGGRNDKTTEKFVENEIIPDVIDNAKLKRLCVSISIYN